MTTVETAEQIVEQMSADELTRSRRWFAEFDSKAWDKQIEADVTGELDALAEEALAEYRAGKAKEIGSISRQIVFCNASTLCLNMFSNLRDVTTSCCGKIPRILLCSSSQ